MAIICTLLVGEDACNYYIAAVYSCAKHMVVVIVGYTGASSSGTFLSFLSAISLHYFRLQSAFVNSFSS